MNTKNLIFDLDGTLWDSTPAIAEGWNRILQRSPAIASDDVRQVAGLPMDEIFRLIEVEPSPQLLQRLIDSEHQVIEDQGAELFPGVTSGLAQLAKCYRLFIVSNCQQGYIELFLRRMELGAYFEDHLCWGDTLLPKGETIRQLMQSNNLKDAVYIGDTCGDQIAAEVAGIPFIFASYGFGQAEEPQVQIEQFSELTEVFPCP